MHHCTLTAAPATRMLGRSKLRRRRDARLRLRDRRCRLRRLRTRCTAYRGSGRERPPRRGRAGGCQGEHPRALGLRPSVQDRRRLGLLDRPRGGLRRADDVPPALDRPTLTLETNLQVQRVLIDRGRAVGIAAQRLGEPFEALAEREVILSAGAYNTPQLMMLSGVGPAEHLTMRDIDVAVDLP